MRTEMKVTGTTINMEVERQVSVQHTDKTVCSHRDNKLRRSLERNGFNLVCVSLIVARPAYTCCASKHSSDRLPQLRVNPLLARQSSCGQVREDTCLAPLHRPHRPIGFRFLRNGRVMEQLDKLRHTEASPNSPSVAPDSRSCRSREKLLFSKWPQPMFIGSTVS